MSVMLPALLPPTPGGILKQFATPDPVRYPALAFPFHHMINGKTATFVGDGESVLLWTRRRLPGYRDWVHTADVPGDFSPATWITATISGAAYPLPRPLWGNYDPVRMIVSGQVAFIPHRLAVALHTFDTCRVGLARLRSQIAGHPVPAVSVHWTLGSLTGDGLVMCAEPPGPID